MQLERRDADTIFRLRWDRLRLSQAAFARRFGLSYATVQNVEQGRYEAKPLVRLVLAAIEINPDLMAAAAVKVAATQAGIKEQ